MLIDHVTTLSPPEVLDAAKTFFARRNPIYAAFLEKEGPTFAAFRGQGGEEIIIGVQPGPNGQGTAVRGSTYLFTSQVARFFATLPPADGTAAPALPVPESAA
ncbi:MAG TPA: hypothetical protein VFK13_04580 [Gemmatimonadaceae bacterium]|nr:hypothetical protein [Gemmatimonadaceae bacterium]